MRKLILLFTVLMGIMSMSAQEMKKPKTLFPYPTVPDTIQTLENRSNYFIANFWNNFNYSKQVKEADNALFESAFADYVEMFRFAHRNVVKSSINDIMNKAQSNMHNFWMFAECAENCLYSANAVLNSDEAYSLFIQSILKSSKLKKNEKERYRRQLAKMNTNQINMTAVDFEYKDRKGDKHKLHETDAVMTLLVFTDPGCEDCRMARLRLSTNVVLNTLIDNKQLAVVFIYPEEYSDDWVETTAGDPEKWLVGAWEDADEYYDLRVLPSIYLLDKEKTILEKHLTVEDLISRLNR